MKTKTDLWNRIKDGLNNLVDGFDRYAERPLVVSAIIDILITGGDLCDIIDILDASIPVFSNLLDWFQYHRKNRIKRSD